MILSQTLPIVQRGTPADQIKPEKSLLWSSVQKLTINQHVSPQDDADAELFARNLMKTGNTDHSVEVDGEMYITSELGTVVKTESELNSKVFPDISDRYYSLNEMDWLNWLCEKAILAPNNDVVDQINIFTL